MIKEEVRKISGKEGKEARKMRDKTAWEIDERDYESEEEKPKFLIRYAILAPSGHNTQPWKFSVERNTIAVYADFSRNLPFVDPDNREMYISVGCALANLLIAAEHFHLGYKLDFFPECDENEIVAVAEFFAGELERRKFAENLFYSITLRHTNRNAYETRQINEEILQNLKACADEVGFSLILIKEKRIKSEVAELIARGDLIQMNNKDFRKELASWMRHNWTKSGDGMPGYAFNIPTVLSFLSSFFIKSFNIGKSQSEKDRILANQAPVLGILCSEEDDKLSWVKTGILFEKIALTATGFGVQYAFLNQPIEVPEIRRALKSLLNMKGHPQLLFRLGYAKRGKRGRHTPRRPLQDVMV